MEFNGIEFHLQLSSLFLNFVQTSAKMAKSELLSTLKALSRKIEALKEQHILLQEKVRSLEDLNRELVIRHENDRKDLLEAQKQIEFLSVSYRLADNPEALVAARASVSKLLRTIDSCIRLIKEDE